MEQLKPCPFCGETRNTPMNCDGEWSVVCQDNFHHVEVTAATKADAIAAWNTRLSNGGEKRNDS